MHAVTGGAGNLGWVAAKALLMFLITVALLRFAERRTWAEFDAFDFDFAAAAGAIFGRTATTTSASVETWPTALVVSLAAHRLLSVLRRRPPALSAAVRRPRRILMDHAMVRCEELARAGFTGGDLDALLRQRGVVGLFQAQFLLFEPKGAVSLLRAEEPARPLWSRGRDVETPHGAP